MNDVKLKIIFLSYETQIIKIHVDHFIKWDILSYDDEFELSRPRPDLVPDVDDEHRTGRIKDGGQRTYHGCQHRGQHQPPKTCDDEGEIESKVEIDR